MGNCGSSNLESPDMNEKMHSKKSKFRSIPIRSSMSEHKSLSDITKDNQTNPCGSNVNGSSIGPTISSKIPVIHNAHSLRDRSLTRMSTSGSSGVTTIGAGLSKIPTPIVVTPTDIQSDVLVANPESNKEISKENKHESGFIDGSSSHCSNNDESSSLTTNQNDIAIRQNKEPINNDQSNISINSNRDSTDAAPCRWNRRKDFTEQTSNIQSSKKPIKSIQEKTPVHPKTEIEKKPIVLNLRKSHIIPPTARKDTYFTNIKRPQSLSCESESIINKLQLTNRGLPHTTMTTLSSSSAHTSLTSKAHKSQSFTGVINNRYRTSFASQQNYSHNSPSIEESPTNIDPNLLINDISYLKLMLLKLRRYLSNDFTDDKSHDEFLLNESLFRPTNPIGLDISTLPRKELEENYQQLIERNIDLERLLQSRERIITKLQNQKIN